ncbi:unnamed protein product [Closterium sp. NIES-64]|nr:unnamed protein product [Closterium sp. NIES-64]
MSPEMKLEVKLKVHPVLLLTMSHRMLLSSMCKRVVTKVGRAFKAAKRGSYRAVTKVASGALFALVLPLYLGVVGSRCAFYAAWEGGRSAFRAANKAVKEGRRVAHRQVGRFLSADDSSRAEEVAGVSFSLLKTSALSRALLMSLWYRGGMSILLLQGLECIRTGQQKLF